MSPIPSPFAPAALRLNDLRQQIDGVLSTYLDHLDRTAPHESILDLTRVLRGFLEAGGKRLRPLLCVTGWHAAGGVGSQTAALHLAASLELLHASVLIHDDIIDESASRRGHPTAHHTLAALRLQSPPQAALRFGASAALLLGDLTLTWSDQLPRALPLTPRELQGVQPILDAVRRDVLIGQYLDLRATGAPSGDLDTALAITRFKTAHYTVERPLQAGVALAGGSPEQLTACTDFGIPLGEAFQLRDDLLGVFGDPKDTGKPVLDDLREGKHTPLVALTLQRATDAQRDTLRRHLGRPDLNATDAAEVQDIICATGARESVEEMIESRHQQALAALDAAAFRPDAADALRHLADTAVRRSA